MILGYTGSWQRLVAPPSRKFRWTSPRIGLWLGRLLVAVVIWSSQRSLTLAEEPLAARPGAASAIKLDEADNAARAHLERMQRYLADGQWGEAIEALRNLSDSSGERLIALPPAAAGNGEFVRFVPLREYCQWRLAALAREAPQALDLYRQRVDPLAEAWLKQAVAERDLARLREIADRFFNSRCGDEALLRLGELELEQGHFSQASYAWERLSPQLRTPPAASPWLHGLPGSPLGSALRVEEIADHWDALQPLLTEPASPLPWLAYPDTDLDLGAVRARLALVSILEGSPQQAQRELALLGRLAPESQGTLGGKSGRYVELLTELLASSRTWPLPPQSADWLTFGGNPTRGKTAAGGIDVALQPIWSVPLPRRSAGDAQAEELLAGEASPIDTLCYHPLIAGSSVLVATGDTIDDIHGYDLDTGRPLWLETSLPPDVVAAAQIPPGASRGRLGAPQYTLTLDGDRLYAKLGRRPRRHRSWNVATRRRWAISPRSICGPRRSVCLKSTWIRSPFGEGWAIEGVPVAADGRLYVALRQRDSVRTQTYLAAFDAKRGELVWQRFVAAAESFAQAQAVEYTHNLLSLSEGVLFYNSNLGVVAAVRADDGRLLWLTRYPSVPRDDLAGDRSAPAVDRALSPCLIHRGLVLVAPSDCDRLFALDSATGLVLWATEPGATNDVQYLLGVGGGNLIAGGSRLYWIDAETGQITARFPASLDDALRGFGRGLLAGEQIYWPTWDRIYVFDQRGPRQMRQPIDLTPLGLTGGNLLISRGRLLIAAEDRLSAFRTSGPEITGAASPP